jgi:hypothetical protein
MPVKLRHICNHCSTHDQNGNAMIEMAIVLPVFIFLFVAFVDFGLYFNKKNVAQSAAWNGAKDCVTTSGGSPLAIVKETLAPLLSVTELANDVAATCTPDTVGVTIIRRVTVTVAGDMLAPFIPDALDPYPIIAVGIAN